MEQRNLYFCTTGVPALPQTGGDSGILVPLRVEVLLQHRDRPLRPDMCTEPADLVSHVQLQDEVDTRWTAFLAAVDESWAYEQTFVQTTSPIPTWQRRISAALAAFSPNRVFLPEACRDLDRTIHTDSELLDWALHSILAGASEGYAIEYFKDANDSETAAAAGSPVWDRSFETLGDRLVAARWAVLRLQGKLQSLESRAFAERGVPSPRALVVSDAGKSWTIRRYGLPGFDADFLDSQQLRSRLAIARANWLANPIDVRAQDDPWDAATRFFRALVAQESGPRRLAVDRIADSYAVLATSLEQDPLVRTLLASFAERGKASLIFPEGAIPLTEQAWHFHKAMHYAIPHSTRFTLDESDTEYWRDHTPSTVNLVESGYLGDTRAVTGVERCNVRVWWWLRRNLTPRFRGRTSVLASVEVLPDFGQTRLGVPSETEMLTSLDPFVDAVEDHNCAVIAKARSALVTSSLRTRYAGRPVMATYRIPWQALASISLCVVTRESSIAIEALSLGYLVVVWNPHPLPSSIEQLAQRFPDSVFVAHDAKELGGILETLLAANRKRRGTRRLRSRAPQALNRAVRQWCATARAASLR